MLTVSDNGRGVSSAHLLTLNEGVGLANTRARLVRLYGERHELSFDTPPASGLAVTLRIPYLPRRGRSRRAGARGLHRMTPTPIRTLVVDDQPLARQRLVALLGEEQDIELVGECADGRAAVEALRRIGPDLVFLDLQMPELDGFEVVEAVGVDRMPVVIFVTAYDEHALRAFEIHAVDYLLKPFSNDRFRSALSHARRQLQRQRAEEFSERLLQLMRTASPRLADFGRRAAAAHDDQG